MLVFLKDRNLGYATLQSVKVKVHGFCDEYLKGSMGRDEFLYLVDYYRKDYQRILDDLKEE